MFKTVAEMLASRAESHPDLLYVRFVKQGEVIAAYTYAQAWAWASRWAATLLERGVRRGDRVILALPNSDDFVGAYFGTLLAGGIPAPIHPFRGVADAESYLTLVSQRIKLLEARVLIVPGEQASVSALAGTSEVSPLAVITRRDLAPSGQSLSPDGRGDELALLQFTSGTSGNAKVVQLSHSALLAQMKNISEQLKLDRTVDWAVSWLPLFHDMGLIGFLLTPVFPAGHVTLLRTEDFMTRPNLWMKTVSRFGASITGGPPSAYALCTRFTRDAEVEQCDLSRLRIALVGAEPISPSSVQPFIQKFRRAKLQPDSLMPTYGLAEAGLAVTMTKLGHGSEFDSIDLESMSAARVARQATGAGSANGRTRTVTCVGEPIPEMEVAILGEAGERLPERRIGEVVVRGTSLMQGYYAQPEASRQALQNGWLRTGDLGYLAGGKLYVTGREKELVIVGGRNYDPEDLEQVAREVPGVRMGRALAIGCDVLERGTEAVVIMAETAITDSAERDALRQRIRHALLAAGYPVSQVVLLRPKTIQNTPNGKLKRLDCKTRFLAGEFDNC